MALREDNLYVNNVALSNHRVSLCSIPLRRVRRRIELSSSDLSPGRERNVQQAVFRESDKQGRNAVIMSFRLGFCLPARYPAMGFESAIDCDYRELFRFNLERIIFTLFLFVLLPWGAPIDSNNES